MKIRVTQKRHISQANRTRKAASKAGLFFMSAKCCPVALAIMEKTGGMVSVRTTDAYIDGRMVALPGSVREFILSWDLKLPVKPFTFELEVPE